MLLIFDVIGVNVWLFGCCMFCLNYCHKIGQPAGGTTQIAIVIKLTNLPVAQHKVVKGLHVWWVKLYGVGGLIILMYTGTHRSGSAISNLIIVNYTKCKCTISH